MDGISTILWDVGGVLLTNGWDRQQRDAVLALFGLDEADFERRHAEVDQAWEKDEIGADEYLRHTVFFEPRNFTQAEFLDAMRAESTLLADSAMGILREVSASEEYVLATVNNESRVMNEFRLTKFNLLDSSTRSSARAIWDFASRIGRFIRWRSMCCSAIPREWFLSMTARRTSRRRLRWEFMASAMKGRSNWPSELVRLGVLPAQDRFRELRVQRGLIAFGIRE